MSDFAIESLNSGENIFIKGARVHNLKNIDVTIPRNKLVVITGVSGSGKSSLAFDTLYAEGQRRYVESLSSYARQFLGKLNKPDVDFIKGISPAIAIEQKVNTRNPRSTVGTSTEIYDYLKLLFARIGKTFSPVSGKQVKRDTVEDVVNYIHSLEQETKISIFSPLKIKKGRTISEQLNILQQQGFSRVKFKEEIKKIDELLKEIEAECGTQEEKEMNKKNSDFSASDFFLLIDRVQVLRNDEENRSRIADSVQTAFYEGEGELVLEISPSPTLPHGKGETNEQVNEHEKDLPIVKDLPAGQAGLGWVSFSNKFELDGIKFEEPSSHFFSFNNPLGACKVCEGFGSIIGIDEDLVVPDKSKSIFEEAIVCWRGEKMSEWKDKLILNNHKFGFPIHKPYCELTEEQKRLLWTGNKYFHGLNDFFKYLERESYKIQYRAMLSRYRGKITCYECRGTRLRRDANYVKVSGKSISDIVLMPVKNALTFFQNIQLENHEREIAKRLLIEITNRLKYLNDVGLGYLTLNRLSSTLSGGESQRINLATSLGSSLVGSMYILDEPSIGLHPRDTERLIGVLQSLKKLGNTVIVVEHDEEIMRNSDYLIDLGPEAGTNGGQLVFQGKSPFPQTHGHAQKSTGLLPPNGKGEINAQSTQKKNGAEAQVLPFGKDLPAGQAGLGWADSFTLKYLTGIEIIETPTQRRKWKNYIEIIGAKENNLKNISVKFPLEVMTVITGVSGSGKSSLLKKILYPSLKKMFTGYGEQTGKFDKIEGDFKLISGVEFVDQNPIGKSSRSNPVTYIKAYDEIRYLFAEQQLSKRRNYRPFFFSFNVSGGRCDVCEGEGEITVEMQFMADVHLVCEECKGRRFKNEILEIEYKGKNISDVLLMTVDDAIKFFSQEKEGIEKRIVDKLKPLQDVGLGYVQLGQSSSTLSGGEAQRIKLASFLGMGNAFQNHTFFIFDEPTTGLHFHDIKKLLKAFNALIAQGHSIAIIEHNLEVVKCADWVIDLGPEGGEEGGFVVFEGTPEDLINCEKSYTGKFLKKKLKK